MLKALLILAQILCGLCALGFAFAGLMLLAAGAVETWRDALGRLRRRA